MLGFSEPIFIVCVVILMLTSEMHDRRTTHRHRCKLVDFGIICFNLMRKASFTIASGTLPKHQMYPMCGSAMAKYKFIEIITFEAVTLHKIQLMNQLAHRFRC